MKDLFPILAVSLAAFYIWLAVRIANRRERWAKWTLAGAIAFPLLYVLSFGPACWFVSRHGGGTPEYCLQKFYWPIGAGMSEAGFVERLFRWYAEWGMSRGSRILIFIDPGDAGNKVHKAISISGPPELPTVKTMRALNKPTSVDWRDFTLRDCVQYLGEYHGLAIHFDENSLTAANASLDVPVTLQAEGVSLRSVLRLLLDPLKLDYCIVETGQIVVTTPEIAADQLIEFSYEVGDAVKSGIPMAGLVDGIAQTVDRTEWQVNGGRGSLRGRAQTLFVQQRLVVHEHVQDLLRELLREFSDDPLANGDDRLVTNEYHVGDLQARGLSNSDLLNWLCEFLLVEESPEFNDNRIASIKGETLTLTQPAWVQQGAAELFQFLQIQHNSFLQIPNNNGKDQPRRELFEMAGRMLSFDVKRQIACKRLALPCSTDFRNLPLEDALLYLRDASQMNVHVDEKEIKRAGIDLKSPLTLKTDHELVRDMFDKVLAPQKLDWYLREPGLIVVTTRAAASARMEPRVFRTQKLLATGQTESGLIKRITTSIEPESWMARGGPGAVHPLPGLLIVVNSRRVDDQISRWLARLEAGQND